MLYSFENSITDLPNVIPLFPLNKVLLLPRAKLPLNLFENRYLHMLDYALSNKKIIGMIQIRSRGICKHCQNRSGCSPLKVH